MENKYEQQTKFLPFDKVNCELLLRNHKAMKISRKSPMFPFIGPRHTV